VIFTRGVTNFTHCPPGAIKRYHEQVEGPAVAQVSKPAVSPISKSAEGEVVRFAGLETRDTADLEVVRYRVRPCRAANPP
jgi:hypothetical protein